uniref:Uncharacterized protein n=1 Tax=Alexandrium andersonii TaxID=327968 RepID=A0A7S2B8Y1_9DINO|mmetsp:Transcript_2339/g.5226  ORF Transcript_2339/g.5226 Transcript_2339/m.5226 type:complete len:319 (+) Transcript_2339:61-1017(+)
MEASRRHRHAQLGPEDTEIDEVDALPMEANPRTAELVRKATRSARTVAAVALALAIASSVGTAVLLYRLHRAEASAVSGNQQEFVSFSEGGWREQHAVMKGAELPGHFRVYLNTIVREDLDLQSPRVGVLAVGDRVLAVERQGRRVRIEHPLRGWASLETNEGVEILRPDEESADEHAGPHESGLALMAQDPKAKSAAELIRKRAATFTEIEHKLTNIFQKMNEFVAQQDGKTVAQVLQTEEIQRVGKAVVGGALELSKRTAQEFSSQKQAAEQLLQQKITPEARDNLLRGAQRFAPEKLFGQEGTDMVNAWKDALGK